ncbi:hypothetical protein [Streptomyces sp. LN704]|uniref:hypothetical protein n=1 Tax=unclassified Streptomyces TaxID=2593676 RepID=UPI00371D6C56
MGPLLIWARRVVDDFADDILAAREETGRLTEQAEQAVRTRESMARLTAYLDQLLQRGAPVPARLHKGEHQVSQIYIAARAGCPTKQVNSHLSSERRAGFRDYVRRNPGPCPLSTPVTGTVEGRPWTDSIDFTQTPQLMRHVSAACFIVLAYLTGMRPGEVMALEHGCCPAPSDGDRHLIYGRVFKGVHDQDSNHYSAGPVREVPWVAIPPVVTAIRVLERLAPEGGLLFDASVHTIPRGRVSTDRVFGYEAMRHRIEDFAIWASQLAIPPRNPASETPHTRCRPTSCPPRTADRLPRRERGRHRLSAAWGALPTTDDPHDHVRVALAERLR